MIIRLKAGEELVIEFEDRDDSVSVEYDGPEHLHLAVHDGSGERELRPVVREEGR